MSVPHEEKWNAILDAAYRVFGTKGFYETKMAEIAEEAGIAKGTLYLYFSSKEEMFLAMSRRDFAIFLDGLRTELSGSFTFREKLSCIAKHHMEYFFVRRKYERVFFNSGNNDPGMMDMLTEFLSDYMKIVSDVMEQEGLKKPLYLAKALSGILEAYKMDILFAEGFGKEELQDRVEFTVNLFLNGCRGSY
ncbi:TetR/AcrR family transcriptional regulator [Paenibacillus gansuensis]|uniref:TetR/AcrR family transcriptional regulator n=1 Tax=Paenibacillus gansuensis TaxID=306542 RepID=A0ABW5PFG6_9BACL